MCEQVKHPWNDTSRPASESAKSYFVHLWLGLQATLHKLPRNVEVTGRALCFCSLTSPTPFGTKLTLTMTPWERAISSTNLGKLQLILTTSATLGIKVPVVIHTEPSTKVLYGDSHHLQPPTLSRTSFHILRQTPVLKKKHVLGQNIWRIP